MVVLIKYTTLFSQIRTNSSFGIWAPKTIRCFNTKSIAKEISFVLGLIIWKCIGLWQQIGCGWAGSYQKWFYSINTLGIFFLGFCSLRSHFRFGDRGGKDFVASWWDLNWPFIEDMSMWNRKRPLELGLRWSGKLSSCPLGIKTFIARGIWDRCLFRVPSWWSWTLRPEDWSLYFWISRQKKGLNGKAEKMVRELTQWWVEDQGYE